MPVLVGRETRSDPPEVSKSYQGKAIRENNRLFQDATLMGRDPAALVVGEQF